MKSSTLLLLSGAFYQEKQNEAVVIIHWAKSLQKLRQQHLDDSEEGRKVSQVRNVEAEQLREALVCKDRAWKSGVIVHFQHACIALRPFRFG